MKPPAAAPNQSTAFRAAALACALAACGDGVGRPIRAAATGPTTTSDAGSTDVPATPYCNQAAAWRADWAASELQLLENINNLRQGNGNACAGYPLGGSAPLIPSPALRCSARLHAADMTARSFFSQTNPDSVGPSERMTVAGFPHGAAAEDIASGDIGGLAQFLPAVIEKGEPASCALADPTLTYAGVGKSGNFWVIDVANPL
jgi:uncharacterized protein YkwD